MFTRLIYYATVPLRRTEEEAWLMPFGYLLDLWEYNRQVLLDAGLKAGNILTAGVCTEHNHEMFCSYRAEQGKTGRMGVCLYRMSAGKNA